MELGKKVAIVTGASRGIGKAISLALSRENCDLMISSNFENEINETSDLIRKIGTGKVKAFYTDLTLEENIFKLIEETVKIFKRIDILINNAAICLEKPIIETTTEEWDKVMNINLRAPFILMREALKIMKEKKDGYIINISSAIVKSPYVGFGPYCASKFGLMGLSKSLYEESSTYNYNIKVSTIYPDLVKTSMTKANKACSNLPSYKFSTPDDIANAIIYLLKNSESCIIEDLFIMSKRFL